ncbi:MAG TPA: hypothetical protein VEA37_02670 [Flavobacterium sp.]|nr:hypothetical protein [Flavobacterium sp.]
MKSPFFFDDHPNIVTNKAIQITDIDVASLKSALDGPSAGPLGRPVSVASFAVTYYFFGLNPLAFKVVNLFIHAINGILVAWISSLILARVPNSPLSLYSRRWLGLWVAAIWLVHPINILPVMLAVQRMTLLAGMFLLLALGCHLKFLVSSNRAKWKWAVAAWLIFWPLAVFSKETGLLFPLFVFAIHFFLPNSHVHQGNGNLWIWITTILMSLTAIFVWHYIGKDWLDTLYSMRNFTMYERLLSEARILWFYTAQIIIPTYKSFGLFLDDIPLSVNLLNPWTTLAACLAWAITLILLIKVRYQYPLVCFSFAWFLLGHSLESSFIPLELAYEYRNYVPSIGLILGVGYLGALGLERVKLDHRFMTVSSVIMLPLIVLSLFTWMRSEQLGKPVVGWQLEASNHPKSPSANYVAGAALFKAGYGDRNDPIGGLSVHYYFKQAGVVDPNFKLGYLGLMHWACGSKRPIDKLWIDELAHRLQYSHFSPQDRDLPRQLLNLLINNHDCLIRDDAIKLFLSGSSNVTISRLVQANFYEAVSDYELLVSGDFLSAQNFLSEANDAFPQDRLKEKFANLKKMDGNK